MVLSTQYPIFNTQNHRQLGLWSTRRYKKNEEICVYWGKVIWKSDCKNSTSDFLWDKSNGYVVDADDSTSIAKYANHYVHGVFSANCKLKNIKGKSITGCL